MIEAALFDWDGTLVDTKSAIVRSFQEVTATVVGRPFPVHPKEIGSVFRRRARDTFESLTSDPDELDRLLEQYHAAYMRYSEDSGPYAGTVETLGELRARGTHIGVVTSKALVRVDADAQRFGLAGLIDVVVAGDMYRYPKPHPCSITAALVRLGVPAQGAVYVGDGPHDMLAGHRAGTTTVAATYGVYPERDLRAANPDHVIHDVAEIVVLVDELGRTEDSLAAYRRASR